MKKVLQRIDLLSFSILLWAVIFTSFVMAQLPTATILGVVKDSSGAVVPDTTLTARNVETGQTRTAASAGDGSYRFSALPVGGYEIRAEHAGFQTAVRSGLTLAVGQEAVINFTLEVGAVTQTVAVTAEAPLVNTTSGSLGALVGEQKVADLPLNGRNYIDLTMLQPGISQGPTSGAPGTLVEFGKWFSSNGAPLRSNNYLLDGAQMLGPYGGSSASTSGNTLGVEGIREYRVVTNSFPAEYGMTMGSQMVIVSKGGTNTFHGSLFEYLRNSALDARNFFDYQTPITPRRLPAFTRNNFGGSIGGPIKKDKTFFFAVYEGLRERLGITTNLTVIPKALKGSANVSPLIKPYLAYFPDPNVGTSQYTFPYTQPTKDDYGQMRMDHTFSDKDSMFGRYTIVDSNQLQLVNYPQFLRDRFSRDQFATLSENHVFTPALLNTFRFSYSRNGLKNDSTGLQLAGIPSSSWFMPGTGLGDIAGIGSISIGGVNTWGPDSFSPTFYKKNTFTYGDDMYFTRGRHALKFGTLINHNQFWIMNPYYARGQVSFPSAAQFLATPPITSVYLGAVLNIPADRTYHQSTLGFYLQDDVRVRSNLTLNLGLRYEFATDLNEVHGHAAPLKDALHDAAPTPGNLVYLNPTMRNFSPRFGFAWDVKGDGKTAVRGGFALLYDLANVTAALIQSICSAPFCNLSAVGGPLTSLPFAFPPNLPLTLNGLDYHLQQPHMLQYNLTLERQLPGDTTLTLAYAGSRGFNLMQVADGNPTVPAGTFVNGACVPATAGQSVSQPCWLGNNAARIPLDPRINPSTKFGFYQMYTAGGNSWYNALQFGLLKRMTKGFQFQSSYTFSKTIDTPQGQLQGGDGNIFLSNPNNWKTDKGLSTFDTAHNWRFNAIYQLPQAVKSGGVSAALVNGWQASGILSLQSGYPFNPTIQSNRSRNAATGSFQNFDRPNLVSGRSNDNIISGTTAGCAGVAPGQRLGTPNLWFDPCAFTEQPLGLLGNAGRNTLRGPGLANLDFSLLKRNRLQFLGESGQLEFRAEIFNILNRANFASISPGAGNATANTLFPGSAPAGELPLTSAGVLTRTSTASRQIQFALKLIF
jgi:hypothetical protein